MVMEFGLTKLKNLYNGLILVPLAVRIWSRMVRVMNRCTFRRPLVISIRCIRVVFIVNRNCCLVRRLMELIVLGLIVIRILPLIKRRFMTVLLICRRNRKRRRTLNLGFCLRFRVVRIVRVGLLLNMATVVWLRRWRPRRLIVRLSVVSRRRLRLRFRMNMRQRYRPVATPLTFRCRRCKNLIVRPFGAFGSSVSNRLAFITLGLIVVMICRLGNRLWFG